MKVKVIIKGRVHGVGYRVKLINLALEYGIDRFSTFNTKIDGKEAVICLIDAPDRIVEEIKGRIHAERPEKAIVESVEFKDYPHTVPPIERTMQAFQMEHWGKAIPVLLEIRDSVREESKRTRDELGNVIKEESQKTRDELGSVIKEESQRTRDELGAVIREESQRTRDELGNVIKEESQKTRDELGSVIKEESQRTRDELGSVIKEESQRTRDELGAVIREESQRTRDELGGVIREESQKTRSELGGKIDLVGEKVDSARKEIGEKLDLLRYDLKEYIEVNFKKLTDEMGEVKREVEKLKEALRKAGISV